MLKMWNLSDSLNDELMIADFLPTKKELFDYGKNLMESGHFIEGYEFLKNHNIIRRIKC